MKNLFILNENNELVHTADSLDKCFEFLQKQPDASWDGVRDSTFRKTTLQNLIRKGLGDFDSLSSNYTILDPEVSSPRRILGIRQYWEVLSILQLEDTKLGREEVARYKSNPDAWMFENYKTIRPVSELDKKEAIEYRRIDQAYQDKIAEFREICVDEELGFRSQRYIDLLEDSKLGRNTMDKKKAVFMKYYKLNSFRLESPTLNIGTFMLSDLGYNRQRLSSPFIELHPVRLPELELIEN